MKQKITENEKGGDPVKSMSVNERVRRCRMIEKMERRKEYSKKLGLENVSVFPKTPAKNKTN